MAFLQKAFQFCIQYGWNDATMRYHLMAAVVLTVLGLFSFGLTAVVPVAVTTLTLHPAEFIANMKRLNQGGYGEESATFMIFLAMAWSWALPVAYGIVTHSPLQSSGSVIRSIAYAAIVWGIWLFQSVGLSYFILKRNVF